LAAKGAGGVIVSYRLEYTHTHKELLLYCQWGDIWRGKRPGSGQRREKPHLF